MTISNILRIAGFSTLLFACAGIAAAQGPVTNDNSTSAELVMSAEVQSTLQLNISTNGDGATVSGSTVTSEFTIDFGTLNGLGIGTGHSNKVAVAPEATGALYSTLINLTPVYSGFETQSADVGVTAGGSLDDDLARAATGTITSSSTVNGTPVVVVTNSPSAQANATYVGFFIPKNEVAGSKTATLIYTVTMGLEL